MSSTRPASVRGWSWRCLPLATSWLILTFSVAFAFILSSICKMIVISTEAERFCAAQWRDPCISLLLLFLPLLFGCHPRRGSASAVVVAVASAVAFALLLPLLSPTHPNSVISTEASRSCLCDAQWRDPCIGCCSCLWFCFCRCFCNRMKKPPLLVAFVYTFAFLVVIPGGNLLFERQP